MDGEHDSSGFQWTCTNSCDWLLVDSECMKL